MTALAAIWRLIGVRGAFAIAFAIIAAIALLRLDAVRERAERWETAYDSLTREYTAAQDMASRLAREAREQQEQFYRDLQEQSDVRLAEAESEAQSRADDFIRRNRVLGGQRSCSSSGRTGTGPEGGSAPSVDRPDPDAELVAVPASDVRICTTLHTRLTEAQKWARSLLENEE